MRKFDYSLLAQHTWDHEILMYVAKIHEYKGKQELYLQQKPQELDRLIEIAKIQSTEASNRIEGIVTTHARLKQIMEDKTTPRNRDEKEILGYRNVLNLVHESYDYIPVTPNSILQLHGELMKYTAFSYGGKFKSTPNEIAKEMPDGNHETLFTPLSPLETPDAAARMCEQYRYAAAGELVEPLILIPVFILDFLCIHPFTDGNGRMSRLLTLLLLYQNGYAVGRYISIEKAIADTKEAYYEALVNADEDWIHGNNHPEGFIKYLLGVILSCYRDLDSRLGLIKNNGIRSTAYEIVKRYTLGRLGPFTKQEVLQGCPGVGSSSVEAALKKLTEEEFLQRIGAGKNTRYVKK